MQRLLSVNLSYPRSTFTQWNPALVTPSLTVKQERYAISYQLQFKSGIDKKKSWKACCPSETPSPTSKPSTREDSPPGAPFLEFTLPRESPTTRRNSPSHTSQKLKPNQMSQQWAELKFESGIDKKKAEPPPLHEKYHHNTCPAQEYSPHHKKPELIPPPSHYLTWSRGKNCPLTTAGNYWASYLDPTGHIKGKERRGNMGSDHCWPADSPANSSVTVDRGNWQGGLGGTSCWNTFVRGRGTFTCVRGRWVMSVTKCAPHH